MFTQIKSDLLSQFSIADENEFKALSDRLLLEFEAGAKADRAAAKAEAEEQEASNAR